MQDYDTNIIETIERLIHEYIYNNQGHKPKSIFISKSMVDLLKAECRLIPGEIDGGKTMTICGLRVYEVLQKGVIKITD